jgi:alpha-mannosidase
VRLGDPHHAYTDQCNHQFTYALFPHPGDFSDGGVVKAAYEFNVPLRTTPLAPQTGDMPRQGSFMEILTSERVSSVIIESVKQAEDDDGIIVRLYESAGRSVKVTLRLGFLVSTAHEVNLMEENPTPLAINENEIPLQFAPLEIKTVKLN